VNLKDLLKEAPRAGGKPRMKYGLVVQSDDGHLDYDAFEETKVFFDQHEFEEYIADLFEQFTGMHGGVEQMVDTDDDASPEAKAAAKKLADRQAKKQNPRTIFKMSQHDDWDAFNEHVWFVDKF